MVMRTKTRLFVATLLVVLVFAPEASSGKSGPSGSAKAQSPVMAKIDEYMVYVQLPDGRLMGILGRTIDNEALARYSSDGGYSWTKNQELFRFPEGVGYWNIANAFLGQDGEVHLVCQNNANTQGKGLYEMRFDIWTVRSTAGVSKWLPPKLVWQGYSGSLLSVTQLRSGRILIPFCYLTPRTWAHRGTGFDAFTFMGRFSSKVAYSDDDGDTWRITGRELKEPTPYIGADGGIEPAVIQLKDGRVWMLIRTQDGFFYESYSQDGSVWSAPQPTQIISSDSPASLTRLKDGRLLMLWNCTQRYPYANGGRQVLHGAVSEDEGRTWHGYREVARNPLAVEPPPPHGDHGVTYTVPALTKNGEVITTLTLGPGGGFYILHVDPNWLDATRQSEDFSRGLTSWSTFGTQGVSLVTNPEKPRAHALELHKPKPDWPAAAVWNFPMGKSGLLRMRLLLRAGFQGARIGLTDHFSVPFDALDQNFNLFNFRIGANGKLQNGRTIPPGHWHDLVVRWNCTKSQARVLLDGREITVLPQSRRSVGVNYLRLVSTAPSTDDAGLLLGSLSVDVSQSGAP
jgi:BNR repeat-like domain